MWVDPTTGTLVGGGYVSSYLTNRHAKTIAAEDPTLRRAINSLDALGMVSFRGFGLLPAAVSWQTDVPIRELVLQQTDTGLSYGELLLANSIAKESNQPFETAILVRAESRTWSEVMNRLHADSDPGG